MNRRPRGAGRLIIAGALGLAMLVTPFAALAEDQSSSDIAAVDSTDVPAAENPAEVPDDTEPTWQAGWVLDSSGSWRWGLSDGTFAKDAWINTGGRWYLMGADGVMLTGITERDGRWYYLTDSGAMATGWSQASDGSWYLAGSNGSLKTGWQLVNGSWYWLDPVTHKMATGWVQVANRMYYLASSGAMATGWKLVNGSWYLLSESGSLLTGWQNLGGAWCWLDPENGGRAAQNEARTIGNAAYAFSDTCAMGSSGWVLSNNLWYLAESSGALKTGWQRVNNTWYWLDPDSCAMATGSLAFSDAEYYLDASGAMLCNAWLKQDGISRWFGSSGTLEATISGLNASFADRSIKSGLCKIGDTYYCLEENVIQIGEKTIDGVTHYFDEESGAAISGWQLSETGEWHYYSTDGAMQTGWANVSGVWYYLGVDGAMQTGWVKLDGAWYYLKASGAMQIGWLNDAGTWYYLNGSGAMLTGWAWVNGSWYYLANSGAMQTGWLNLNGTWYYLDPAFGYMHTGWTWDGSSYYWLNADGSLGTVNCKWQDMFQWAQSYYSNTNWLVLVDTANCRTAIYRGAHSAWTPVYEWVCSPGAPSTPTVTGEFTVYGKGYSFGNGYTCYYYTQFYGDYLFHSVLYYQNTFHIMDGRLGQHLSHGCVRLDISNAKWMYDNIPYGTKVVIW